MKLIQKYFFGITTFTIGSSFVEVHEREILVSRKYKVLFEKITSNPSEVSVSSKKLFIVAMVFLFFTISSTWINLAEKNYTEVRFALTNLAGCFIFFLIWYFLSRRTYIIHAQGEQTLALLKNNPSEKQLNIFIDQMMEKKKEYLRNTYLPNSGELRIVQELQNLSILKANGDISEEEFNRIKNKLLSDDKQDKNNSDQRFLGFGDN